jgi:hypothetical protein
VEFVGEQPAGIDGLAAMSGAGRVAALQDEAGDETVEDGAVVVVVVAQLQEVAGRLRRLLAPELELEVAEVRLEEDLGAALTGQLENPEVISPGGNGERAWSGVRVCRAAPFRQRSDAVRVRVVLLESLSRRVRQRWAVSTPSERLSLRVDQLITYHSIYLATVDSTTYNTANILTPTQSDWH